MSKQQQNTGIAALKAVLDEAEKEHGEAYAAKIRAVALEKETWKVAAAAFARHKRAKDKMELAQMRAGGAVEAGMQDEPA